MIRLIVCVLTCIHWIIILIPMTRYYHRHPEKYDEAACYRLARKMVNIIQRHSRISTEIYGRENLPKEGGYIMYSNHQDRYDMLGIVSGHDEPCTMMIKMDRSKLPWVDECVDLLHAKRVDQEDPRQAVTVINEIADEVRAGRRYVIFPEGRHDDNHNELLEFKHGCFKSAQKAQCPIVPVCLVDSWKSFTVNNLKSVRTQVHFLKPIPYEEYKDLRSVEIAELVKSRIQECMTEELQRRQSEQNETYVFAREMGLIGAEDPAIAPEGDVSLRRDDDHSYQN